MNGKFRYNLQRGSTANGLHSSREVLNCDLLGCNTFRLGPSSFSMTRSYDSLDPTSTGRMIPATHRAYPLDPRLVHDKIFTSREAFYYCIYSGHTR
jgi:hypothetical protein